MYKKIPQSEAIANTHNLEFQHCEGKTEIAFVTDVTNLVSLPQEEEFFSENEEFIYSNLLKVNRCEHAFYGVLERIVWDSKARIRNEEIANMHT